MALPIHIRAREGRLKAEAVREVGVLLVAFSPLDTAFSGFDIRAAIVGLFFFLLGLLLFALGLERERNLVDK